MGYMDVAKVAKTDDIAPKEPYPALWPSLYETVAADAGISKQCAGATK